jgi:hypothetical protein
VQPRPGPARLGPLRAGLGQKLEHDGTAGPARFLAGLHRLSPQAAEERGCLRMSLSTLELTNSPDARSCPIIHRNGKLLTVLGFGWLLYFVCSIALSSFMFRAASCRRTMAVRQRFGPYLLDRSARASRAMPPPLILMFSQ